MARKIVRMRVHSCLIGLALAACGSGDDGNPGDVDGPMAVDGDAGATGNASVIVTKDGLPVAGARVYFQGADQSLIAAVDTDTAGTASAEVASGAWVSVLAPYLSSGQPWIETIGGVKPGDVLRFGAPSQVAVDLTVSIPKDPGAVSYEVYANCHDEHASSVTVLDAQTTGFDFAASSCPAAIDVLVISRDAGGARQKWLLARQQVPSNDRLTITGTYVATMRTVTLAYSNLPVDTEQLTMRYQLAAAADARVLFGDEVVVDTFANQSATTTLTVPDGIAAVATASASAHRPGNIQDIVDGLAPATATLDVDFGVALSGFASAAAYDRDAGTISWTATDGTERDLAFAFLLQRRTAGAETITWYRTVVQPYGGAQIAVPRLPVESFDYNATSSDTASVSELATATVPGGYDAIRARYFDTFNPFVAPSLVDAGERALLVEAR
jgi:hypothetical protein